MAASDDRAGDENAVNELVRDDGPHDADAGACPARPPRRSFLRGALGAGVTGAVAGAAAGAGAGYAYRASQAAPPGQAFDASLAGAGCPQSRSTGGIRRASWPSRSGRRSCSRSL